MERWHQVRITESEFARVIGKIKMAPYKGLKGLEMTDGQLNQVIKGYYDDQHFRGGKSLSLWSFYNLLTSANKSSYINSFAYRAYRSTKLI